MLSDCRQCNNYTINYKQLYYKQCKNYRAAGRLGEQEHSKQVLTIAAETAASWNMPIAAYSSALRDASGILTINLLRESRESQLTDILTSAFGFEFNKGCSQDRLAISGCVKDINA